MTCLDIYWVHVLANLKILFSGIAYAAGATLVIFISFNSSFDKTDSDVMCKIFNRFTHAVYKWCPIILIVALIINAFIPDETGLNALSNHITNTTLGE